MLNYKKLNEQISALLKKEEEKEAEEQKTSGEIVKESAPKTVVYDKLPSVSITYPQKPTVEAPKYEKVEYTPPTDEEIQKTAEEELKAYKDASLESFDSSFEKTKAQKEQEKALKESLKQQDEAKVEEEFKDVKTDIDYDLIKRGTYDSSANALLKEKSDIDKANALDKVSQDYANEIAKIDNAIAKAEVKRQEAINDFNIAYALKYAARVKKLKEARDSAVEKAIKQNNAVLEQEFQDQIDKAKTESKLYGEALEHYQTEKIIENKAQYEVANSYEYRIYTILREQLAGMSKQDAYNALRNDPTYSKNLTTTYFMKLVDEFGRGQWIPYDREYGEN